MFEKLFEKFQTSNKKELGETEKAALNWYAEKYEALIIQRNFFAVLVLLSLIAVAISVFVVFKISTSKEFEPFVIQVNSKTGETKIVNPLSSKILLADQSMAEYFIRIYINARESYNTVDFESNARTTIRLMSTQQVYSQYLGYINNKVNSPIEIYGNRNTTFIKIKSWSKIDNKKYLVRFTVFETDGEKKSYNKIAIIEFDYFPMKLTENELEINPVGFQVTGYRVDDDNS